MLFKGSVLNPYELRRRRDQEEGYETRGEIPGFGKFPQKEAAGNFNSTDPRALQREDSSAGEFHLT